ncbi:MAG: hypothetical protein QXL96_03330 [Ignisphaera sp.]
MICLNFSSQPLIYIRISAKLNIFIKYLIVVGFTETRYRVDAVDEGF